MKKTNGQSIYRKRSCDIFLSYRRDGGDMTAMYMNRILKEKGYDVFYDLEVLRNGRFNEALLDYIRSCRDFVLILSPHALDRCMEKDDWVRLEITEAIRHNKNIIPVMQKGFEFPRQLPPEIDSIRYQNGLSTSPEYFAESVDRLCERYLVSKPAVEQRSGRGLTAVLVTAVLAVIGLGAWLGLRSFSGRQAPLPAALSTVSPTVTPPGTLTVSPTPVLTPIQTLPIVSPTGFPGLTSIPTPGLSQAVSGSSITNSGSWDYILDTSSGQGISGQTVTEPSTIETTEEIFTQEDETEWGSDPEEEDLEEETWGEWEDPYAVTDPMDGYDSEGGQDSENNPYEGI